MDQPFWSAGHAAGILLVLCTLVVFPGLMMFWIRGGQRGGAPPSPGYYVWERRFVMAGAVLAAGGFVLLGASLENTTGGILARAGVTGYLIAATLMAAGEALNPTVGYGKLYPVIAVSVALAFLAQALIGASLLQAGLLPVWIGWATIVWNLAWLVILPLLTPRDVYFPALHYAMPLVIGVALLLQTP